MSDVGLLMRFDAIKKTTVTAYILWWLFGLFGGHRFDLGRSGSAITMLLISLVSLPLMFVLVGFVTIMITVVWALVDAFPIPCMVRDYNLKLTALLQPAG